MAEFGGVDLPITMFGRAFTSRFTTSSKALQLQIEGPVGGISWGDSFVGNWCVCAPPLPPRAGTDVDAQGNVSAAVEVVGAQIGDAFIAFGARDVRWSKFAQDAKPGYPIFFNVDGSRLFLGQFFVSLASAGGAFLNFDIRNKKVGLAGFPDANGQSGYLTIDASTSTIGLVSATGASSITLKTDNVTAIGASASLNFGTVALGTGASDFVALASKVDAALTAVRADLDAIKSAFSGHTHAAGTLAAPSGGGPVTGITGSASAYSPSYSPTTVASTRVKAA